MVVPDVAPRPRVVYWTDHNASWSRFNDGHFRHLWRALRNRYDCVVVFRDRDSLRERVAAASAASTDGEDQCLAAVMPPDAQRAARFRESPMTVVINENRRVVRAWAGAYIGSTRVEIEAFFNMVF